MSILIKSTVNPNGSSMEHFGGFDPSGKAIFKDGQYIVPIQNTLRKPRTLLQEATTIIQMTSKRLEPKKIGRVGR